MKSEKPYSFYDYQISPNYNDIKKLPISQTPQVPSKKETSQTILSQTKASLNNFLSNLKKGSAMNDIINENKKKKLISTMNNISHISNQKYPDDDQAILESYLRLSKLYDNNNLLNLNKINNINNINTYREINKNLSQNNNNYNYKTQIRLNKIIDNNLTHNNTESNLIDNKYMYFNNNNNDISQINFGQYNTVKRTKYNFGLGSIV